MNDTKKASLEEKLNSLGVRVGLKDRVSNSLREKSEIPIQNVVNGRFVSSRLGEVFMAEQIYPGSYQHGSVPLYTETPLHTIAQWAREPGFTKESLDRFAFLDTETSGLAGGTGTYAFLVGIGKFEGKSFHLAQYFMRDPAEEQLLLEGVAEFLAPCTTLITFNGKAFDAPLLSTRYFLHDIPIPFRGYAHIDLLPLARRLWHERLSSCALKFLEEEILGAPRSFDEVPGYEIPSIYFEYLRTRDATPLKGVFYHNAMDIIALAALMNQMASILHDPLGGKVNHGLDFISIARLFEDLNRWEEAAHLYEHGLQVGLDDENGNAAIQRLSGLQRRRGEFNSALELWHKAASEGQFYAHIDLAKYFEHRKKDYQSAMNWTNKAMEILNEMDLPRYIVRQKKAELTKRSLRLQKKMI
jgi:uncharacterized protein